jgi:hypothetical protein
MVEAITRMKAELSLQLSYFIFSKLLDDLVERVLNNADGTVTYQERD